MSSEQTAPPRIRPRPILLGLYRQEFIDALRVICHEVPALISASSFSTFDNDSADNGRMSVRVASNILRTYFHLVDPTTVEVNVNFPSFVQEQTSNLWTVGHLVDFYMTSESPSQDDDRSYQEYLTSTTFR